MFNNIKIKVDVRKRFVIALLALFSLSFMAISLLILFIIKQVTFTEINPLLMALIPAITAVAGFFFGAQTYSDVKNKKEVAKV